MSVLIREITLEDAEGYNIYRRQIADEPHNTIGLTIGEYTRTIEQEKQHILSVMDDPNQHILLAIIDGMICGQCMCRGESKSVLRHAVTLGIDIAQAHRGQWILSMDLWWMAM